jgi:hypothetical protein
MPNAKGKSVVDVFRSREKDILEYVNDRKDSYFGSEVYRRLKNRMSQLDDSIDMKFHPTRNGTRTANDFKSKIAMPLVREKFRILQGMALASFRNDPMITVLPDGETTFEAAGVSQMVLDQNFRRTRFREKGWRGAVGYAGRYGVAVMVNHFRKTDLGGYEKMQQTPFGIQRLPMQGKVTYNVFNRCINPLNYMQNEHIADPDDSDFRGWIERIPLSQLIAEFKDAEGFYVKENLRKVIEKAKKDFLENQNFFSKNSTPDWRRAGLDLEYWYGKINIDGFEEDETCYYIEKTRDEIIRISTNPNDEGIVPISIYSFDRRLDRWCGNSPVENSMPMENFLNIILGMRADQGMKTLERFLFFDKSIGVDPADLNNRKRNGGYIPFEGKGRAMSEIFYEFQPKDFSANSIEPLIREVKEADQRLSIDSDFNRSATSGGPQNETATAAVMMDEKGNVLKSDLLECFSYGLVNTARNNLIKLQEQLPETFMITPRYGNSMMVEKGRMLGTYDYQIHTALTKNKVIALNNLMNMLTSIQNYRGTQDPAWLNVNLPPLIKKYIQEYDLGLNIDEVYPQQMPMQQQQPMMGAGAPQGMPGGGPPPPEGFQQPTLQEPAVYA